MKQGLLINTANIHVGGGVQVAASLLSELSRQGADRLKDISVMLSSEVSSNLPDIASLERQIGCAVTCDVKGFELKNAHVRRFQDRYDAVFTLFGPLYRWRPPFLSIVGFAQAWIIYPENECYEMLPAWARIKTRVKFWIQAQFFKRADILVVELDHVKNGLVRQLRIDPARIRIVRNCLSSIYFNEDEWQSIDAKTNDSDLKIGFVGRNYLHKNTSIFPRIAAELQSAHGIKARFFVTFTEQEWRKCTPEFRDVCVNVGPLSVAQCPNFYKFVDAVIFPSLLECFSATPLEAMAMEKPLFAADRPFNRDICSEHAHYFDPLNPTIAATIIADYFKRGGGNVGALARAREHAISFSNATERAEKYLSIICESTKGSQDKA